MLQPFSSEIFWFEKLSFSWNRVSWLCQSACGECFLCWVISGLPGDQNIKAQPFKRSWSFEDIRGRYIVGQIWSWWFPDFLLKKIGGTSFLLILGTRPQPACLVAASKPFVLFLSPSHEPATFFPAYLHSLYRETCTKNHLNCSSPFLRTYNTPKRAHFGKLSMKIGYLSMQWEDHERHQNNLHDSKSLSKSLLNRR